MESQDAEVYKWYLAEGLRVISENTGRFAGGYALNPYVDIASGKTQKEETRTGEEIISHMKDRLNALGGEG